MLGASYLGVKVVVVAVRELACLWRLREAADPVQDVVGWMSYYLGYELGNAMKMPDRRQSCSELANSAWNLSQKRQHCVSGYFGRRVVSDSETGRTISEG